MRKAVFGSTLALVGLALVGLAPAPACAQFVINPTFDSSITSDPNAASIEATINAAISVYEAKFSDPITVNIKFQEMTSGLGQSSTAFSIGPYSVYLAALTADKKTSDDATALAHLGAGPLDPVLHREQINVKTANLRAVGINVFPGGGFDGIIGLNTHLTDPGSPGSISLFDLRVVAEHEIDEVLGLGSSLPGIPSGNIFPEDLYRYDSLGNRSFTTNSTAKSFFSIDGTTDLAQFDNQNDGGDFGDWQSNPLSAGVSPKVQDAFASFGAHPTLGVELRALDVIGYDLKTQTAVPEPSSIAFLVGMIVPGAFLARRKLRK